MIITDEPLLFEACRQLQLRDLNDGDWPDHTIPDVFAQIRDTYLPRLKVTGDWLRVVVGLTLQSAVHHLGTQTLLSALAKGTPGITINLRAAGTVTVKTRYRPYVVGVGPTLPTAVEDCARWLWDVVNDEPEQREPLSDVLAALTKCGIVTGHSEG
ncbi:MAG: hypothetical protein ACYDH4_10825 [Candidatus Cryosericum sp.]